MKGSEVFKETIKAYLEARAERDNLFAQTYKKENKNLDDCISYILQTVQKSGVNGFDDSEIFGMAVHYYDEDDLEVTPLPEGARVVINHHVEITEEEKEEMKKKALDSIFEEERNKILKKSKAKKTDEKEEATSEQLGLF